MRVRINDNLFNVKSLERISTDHICLNCGLLKKIHVYIDEDAVDIFIDILLKEGYLDLNIVMHEWYLDYCVVC